MAWLIIVAAGILEAGFAICLKLSHGFSRLMPTVLFAIFAVSSFGLLTLGLRSLEVGPAYAVWTGLGAAGTVMAGMIWLGESVSAAKLLAIGLVLVGVIGLQLSGGAH
jgi:quaternary ammonium compound-resistance protein SugE